MSCNMKVTEPIDVYIADKLFQLTSADTPAALTEEDYRAGLAGKTLVAFGGSDGIGGDIAELARAHGAMVKAFSRSSTGTHVERRNDLVAAARSVLAVTGRMDFVVNTAGVLPRGYTRGRSGYSLYSSAKAAVVNRPDPGPGRRVGRRGRAGQLRQPGADRHPDAEQAFGEEAVGTLLSSTDVARQSLDVLLSGQTGQ